ncbi:hypothetical protein N0V90_004892 [Kalmusia sp. IMI 367209]|nr:hypothetical protein N0V90_004892 [Kalmusia sp. IMI 367209]
MPRILIGYLTNQHVSVRYAIPLTFIFHQKRILRISSSPTDDPINCSMAQLTRRFFFSTVRHLNRASASASASEACSEIFARFGSKPISIRTQLLDANQLHLLNVTLGRSPTSTQTPAYGTPIPPGYHLVYFTPSILEDELGLDGTDRTVNPLSPFTRRMWAGGELQWTQDEASLLRVGQEVQETTKMLSAEPKKLRSGEEMLVVSIEKTFENNKGVALIDQRNWVFQKEIKDPKPPPSQPEARPLPKGDIVRDFTQSYTDLFRFSALTFNAHKIHYLPEWCRDVEGHRDAVVHGPLNLINMLDLWRDTTRGGKLDAVPASISYRAMSPLYVREQYRILLKQNGQDWDTDIWDSFGKQSMRGHIVQ